MTIKPFGQMPDIVINIDAVDYGNYRTLVDTVSPNEVQWYSMVNRTYIDAKHRTGKKTKPLVIYTVSDMVIPSQEVSAAQVDTDVRKDPMKVYAIYQELCARYPNDSEAGFDEELVNAQISRMHCWCHSHPFTDNPKPSGQDDSQFEDWVKENQISQGIDTPMIALIFGKTEKIHARVFDPQFGDVFWDNQSVNIVYSAQDSVQKYINDAVANKITEAKRVTQFSHNWKSWYANRNKSALSYSSSKKSTSGLTLASSKKKEKTDKEKAIAMFAKKFEGGETAWLSLLDSINKFHEDTLSVQELVEFLAKHWLTDSVQLAAFASAATVNIDVIDQFNKDAVAFVDFDINDVVNMLLEHVSGDTLCSQHLKAAITFAKKVTAATASNESTATARKDLYQVLENLGLIEYESSSSTASSTYAWYEEFDEGDYLGTWMKDK